MADKKISALTAATTPLAGTEVLPIVQSGATVKVANNDLRPKQIQSNATSGVLQIAGPAAAATRVMTVPDANFTAARTDAANSFTGDQTLSTGNLIQGTAAKGINFTANTGAAGQTSQLLNWYEEGTWTPSISNAFNNYTHTIQVGRYTRVGNLVTLEYTVAWTTTNAGALTFIIEGLPFTPVTLTNYASAGSIGVADNLTNTNQIVCQIESATSQIKFYARASGSTATALASSNWNTGGSTNKISGTICYQV